MEYQQQVWTDVVVGNEFQNESGNGGYRPGVNYDPVADRIVVWDGGAVQALNMDTQEWQELAVAPLDPNETNPRRNSGLPEGTGTYGRFRYSPTQNAYILVNGGSKDVLIYKLQNIPEPTSAALLLAAIPFTITRRRRRRN